MKNHVQIRYEEGKNGNVSCWFGHVYNEEGRYLGGSTLEKRSWIGRGIAGPYKKTHFISKSAYTRQRLIEAARRQFGDSRTYSVKGLPKGAGNCPQKVSVGTYRKTTSKGHKEHGLHIVTKTGEVVEIKMSKKRMLRLAQSLINIAID